MYRFSYKLQTMTDSSGKYPCRSHCNFMIIVYLAAAEKKHQHHLIQIAVELVAQVKHVIHLLIYEQPYWCYCMCRIMYTLTINYCVLAMHHCCITSCTYRMIAVMFEPCICLCRNSNGFNNGTHFGKVQCLFYAPSKADNDDVGYSQDSWQWHSDKILHGLAIVRCFHVAFSVSTPSLFLFLRISLKLSGKHSSFGEILVMGAYVYWWLLTELREVKEKLLTQLSWNCINIAMQLKWLHMPFSKTVM